MSNSYYKKRKFFCNKQNFRCNKQNCLKIFSLLKLMKRFLFFFSKNPFLIGCKRCGHINIFHSRKTNPNWKISNQEYI